MARPKGLPNVSLIVGLGIEVFVPGQRRALKVGQAYPQSVDQLEKVEKYSSQAKGCPKRLPNVSLTQRLVMEVFVQRQGVP